MLTGGIQNFNSNIKEAENPELEVLIDLNFLVAPICDPW